MNPLLETGADLTVELARYRRLLRQTWLPTVGFGLAGLAVGLLVTLQIPPAYQATTGVFAPGTPTYLAPDVEPSPSASPPDPRDWTQDTEAELVHSTVVLRAAAKRLGTSWTPDELTDRIQISVPTSTRVFSLTFTAGDPATAQRGAQVVAEEYVRHRSTLLADRAQRVGDALRDRRTSLETLLSGAPDEAEPTTGGRGATKFPVNLALRAEIRAQIARIDEALSTAASTGANRAEVVTRAERPVRSARANAEVAPVSGILAGLLAGLGLGFVRDRGATSPSATPTRSPRRPAYLWWPPLARPTRRPAARRPGGTRPGRGTATGPGPGHRLGLSEMAVDAFADAIQDACSTGPPSPPDQHQNDADAATTGHGHGHGHGRDRTSGPAGVGRHGAPRADRRRRTVARRGGGHVPARPGTHGADAAPVACHRGGGRRRTRSRPVDRRSRRDTRHQRETRTMTGTAAQPSISVVIATRDRPELLRRAVRAVVDQTYDGPIECVVVFDQVPLDDQPRHGDAGAHRPCAITNTRTPGLAGARNAGIDAAAR